MRRWPKALRALLASVFLALAVCNPAAAVEPDEILDDPALEARARALSAELRCLVCQNQSIDDSNAPLARDLRLVVRERLKTGDSDKKIMEYVVQRYGEFVLLRPRFTAATLLLWIAPLLLLGCGAWLAWRLVRRPAGGLAQTEQLSEAERARLAELLDDLPRKS